MDITPPDPQHVALYEGTVVDNADPELLGRVRIQIPGLIEPASGWALPIGSPGGGSPSAGFFFAPKIGANVAVFFKQGDVDHPRYLVGPWARREAPSFLNGCSAEEATEVQGIQTGRWEIVLDDRDGAASLRIRDLQFPLDVIEIDGVTHGVTISGSAAVVIKTLGVVSIDALQILLNGRLVRQTADPI